MRDRYSLIVGVIFLALIVVASVKTLGGGSDGEDILGLDSSPPGRPLPEFAVPSATGTLEGDANVAQDDCESGAIPCPESERRKAACQIELAGAIRDCDLFDRPLVISFWFTKSAGGCVPQQDLVEQVWRRYRGRVNFLSLDVGDDPGTVRELTQEHGWEMPVGYDRDGAVGSLLRVGVCPTFAYAYPGGALQASSIGELTAAGLSARVQRLLRATRRAEAGEVEFGREAAAQSG